MPKENQADALMIIAKNRGVNRNDLINEIIVEIADNLPDVEYVPDFNIQITIYGADMDRVSKIRKYCNSINSSFGEQLRRGIDDFTRRHHQECSQ